MRDADVIDSELTLLSVAWWSIREHGSEPSNRLADYAGNGLDVDDLNRRVEGFFKTCHELGD